MSTPHEIIAEWSAKALVAPDQIASIGASYKFVVLGPDGGVWTVRCKNPVEIQEYKSAEESPIMDCELILSDEDFVEIAEKKLNPQVAWSTGRLKLAGNVTLALKLSALTGW